MHVLTVWAGAGEGTEIDLCHEPMYTWEVHWEECSPQAYHLTLCWSLP